MRIICECLPDAIQILSIFISMAFPAMYRFGSNVPWYTKYPLYTIWCILYPVLCVVDEFHIIAHERQDGYRRTEPKPKSVHPRWHQRSPLGTRKVQIATNESCQLLKLPRELRDMIWKEALGGCIVHVRTMDRKLGRAKCMADSPACQFKDFSCQLSVRPDDIGGGFLGILMTCSQIYAETIDIVYSLNHFSTRSVETMVFLPRLLPKQGFNSIKSLDFGWLIKAPPSFPHPYRCPWNDRSGKLCKAKLKNHYLRQSWVEVWKNLAAMENLVDLRVELDTRDRSVSNAHLWETSELEVVTTVTRPRSFQLVLHEELAKRVMRDIFSRNLEIIEVPVEIWS